MKLNIFILPGDGIGQEVIKAALNVLEKVAKKWNHSLQLNEGMIGAEAIRKFGTPFPQDTEKNALLADATLLGAVGAPEFDHLPPERRPEKGLLELRRVMGVYANIRPVRILPSILSCSPLKNEVVDGTDLVFVRELTGGLYYGQPRGIFANEGEERAVNTMVYTKEEIERVSVIAFELAKTRRKKVTSVDKANVLETSQFWRKTVIEVSKKFPQVELEHVLVDSCAMQLVSSPRRFDVILTENMFGDILSDEASCLAGSIGMLSSASLGKKNESGIRRGLYEPVHGSAPDIAGQNKANPCGAIGSAAAMLEYSFGLKEEAYSIYGAMEKVLEKGIRPFDLKPSQKPATTSEVAEAVCKALE